MALDSALRWATPLHGSIKCPWRGRSAWAENSVFANGAYMLCGKKRQRPLIINVHFVIYSYARNKRWVWMNRKTQEHTNNGSASISHVWTRTTQAQAQEKGTRGRACACASVHTWLMLVLCLCLCLRRTCRPAFMLVLNPRPPGRRISLPQ